MPGQTVHAPHARNHRFQRGRPVVAADGQVERVVGSTRDTTDRNRAEEAVRKSEERLMLALEAGGGAGVWDWDIPSDRLYCNPQFARLYATDPASAMDGAPLSQSLQHIHWQDREQLAEKLRFASREGGEFAEEYRAVQRNGLVRWIYARGTCHMDQDGNCARFPRVLFDITDKKRVEEDLRDSQQRLRAIYHGSYEYIGL